MDPLRELNARFHNGGEEASTLREAGVLIKVVDGMEDEPSTPWHACLTGWCAGVDHVSASLINRKLSHTYNEIHPELSVAFVLKADAVAVECAMLDDGGTVMVERGGCSRPTCPGGWCVYRFPGQLGAFVHAHLTQDFCASADGPCRETYSEVVILKSEWEAMLERGGIQAVACLRNGDTPADSTCDEARDVWRRYLSAYGLSAAQVPLVRYLGAEVGFERIGSDW